MTNSELLIVSIFCKEGISFNVRIKQEDIEKLLDAHFKHIHGEGRRIFIKYYHEFKQGFSIDFDSVISIIV